MANGLIYLIESVGNYDTRYKVGFSRNNNTVKKRLSAIQTGNPDRCKIIELFSTKHGRKVETSIHNLYSHIRMEGEWFAFDLMDVNSFIETCKKIENNMDILDDMNNPFL